MCANPTRSAARRKVRLYFAPRSARSLRRGEDKETRMSVFRDRPYVQFNFLVDLGDGNTDGPQAGFQECSNIGMEVNVAEYRSGNEKENSVLKITGLNKATDVSLKRGVVGSLNLYQWLNDIRNGI